MAKTINITNVSLKEFSASKIDGKIHIRLVYALLDDTGKEYDTKADSIEETDLNTTQKNYINNMMSVIETKLKTKEQI